MGPEIVFVVGARPNYMKTAPVFRAMRAARPDVTCVLLDTGQHFDNAMAGVFLADLGLPSPDVTLGVGSGSHGRQTGRILERVEKVLIEHAASLVVVAGDVNSTLAAALAAVKLDIPVAHIESGLRSFDNRMPEEHNRRLTDHLSTVLLVHSESAVANLAREGIDGDCVHLVGNTMIDSLIEQLPRALDLRPWTRFGVEPDEFALVTLHRPHLVDDPAILAEALDALRDLSRTLPVIFPVHPRTRARIEMIDPSPTPDRAVTLTEPLDYLTFLGLEARAAFVLTDSGGVQEETSALGTPCFTLRDSTERPVTVDQGTNHILGEEPARIRDVPHLLADTGPGTEIPLWDGRAGERAASILCEFLDRGAT